ncbi:hypothetical protein D3C71_1798050 [compost metagenome]
MQRVAAVDVNLLARLQRFLEQPRDLAFFALGGHGGLQTVVELFIHQAVFHVDRARCLDGVFLVSRDEDVAALADFQVVGAGDVDVAKAADLGGVVLADRRAAVQVRRVRFVGFDLGA